MRVTAQRFRGLDIGLTHGWSCIGVEVVGLEEKQLRMEHYLVLLLSGRLNMNWT